MTLARALRGRPVLAEAFRVVLSTSMSESSSCCVPMSFAVSSLAVVEEILSESAALVGGVEELERRACDKVSPVAPLITEEEEPERVNFGRKGDRIPRNVDAIISEV